jgi:hypothetical protein
MLRPQGNLCAVTEGVENVNVEKNVPKALNSIVSSEASTQQETNLRYNLRYTSDSYQKILDYHVGEILLTTIIFGVIVFLRLHH